MIKIYAKYGDLVFHSAGVHPIVPTQLLQSKKYVFQYDSTNPNIVKCIVYVYDTVNKPTKEQILIDMLSSESVEGSSVTWRMLAPIGNENIIRLGDFECTT